MTKTDKRDALLLVIESFIVLTVMQILMFNTYNALMPVLRSFWGIMALRLAFFVVSGALGVLGFAKGTKGARIYRLSLAVLLAAVAIFELALVLL